MIIKNGKLISGALDKGLFTSTSKGLIHTIYNDLGPKRCKDFIDDLQNIVTEYMKIHGYSVGISDLIADNITKESIIQSISKHKLEVNNIIEKVHLGIFENKTSKTNVEDRICIQKKAYFNRRL